MEITQFLTEERAASSVIGVVLMVAIAVILAAVVGTFVLGLGQDLDSTPTATFEFEFTKGTDGGNGAYNVTITHEGGDSLNTDIAAHINITSTDSEINTEGWLDEKDPIKSGDQYVYGEDFTSSVPEGTSSKDNGSSSDRTALNSGETVRVVFVGPDGNSATLASREVP